jgi:uncharacterized protein YeeX (DUF496 family)
MRKKKGQINVEYIVSLTVYITLATYIAFQLSQQTPIYLRAVREEYVKSETYQLSELLVNDMGEPEDWHTLWPSTPNDIKRLGLSEGVKTNLLSVDKIETLDEICSSDYDNVVDMLGIDAEDYQISIFVKDAANDVILLDCSPTVITTGQSIESIRRVIALGSGDYGELIIQTW